MFFQGACPRDLVDYFGEVVANGVVAVVSIWSVWALKCVVELRGKVLRASARCSAALARVCLVCGFVVC